MSPGEDAALLLGIVRRHLRTLQVGIEAEIPEEDGGFLAHQPGINVAPELLELQVFAVEARYEEGPFRLPESREALLQPQPRSCRRR